MNRVSSIRMSFVLLLFLSSRITSGVTNTMSAQSTVPQKTPTTTTATSQERNPQKLFEAGEAALHEGKLDEAEREFRQVLAIDPAVAGAYANLGVIHMRRKQWPQALEMLHKAEKLAPDLAGIRLNIGLVYFRQNDFARAIRPFESVVQQSPDSYQARYLLGLCYFFNDRWTDAIGALEPLWGKASDQLNYLYVLEHAADKAKNAALEEKAMSRLVEVGEGSPEFHLLMGKAHLNREEYDDAIKELDAAAQADPKLPFVHFNLGLAYTHKQDYDRARTEFHKDIALEPDVPFAYEQLGNVESTVGNEDEAAKNYRNALKLDPQSISSLVGLAKIEEHQRHYAAALSELDQVIRLDSNHASARYLRGQVLVRMGREKEGREELAAATKMLNDQRAARHKELEGETIPSPELAREPQ
jgi:tetratricopeptide (TPR) repeat protein